MQVDVEDFVTDWAAFESLIASVCETGGVSVERDILLVGKSGAPRQIDVAIRTTQGLISHLVLVECKHWKRPVTRQHVDSLSASVNDLNASKGIIFSTHGFQKGTVLLAKHLGIDLFRVRDLRTSEVFGPNTPLSAYRHYLWRSLRNLQFPGIHCWERDLRNSNICITIGGPDESKTPILCAEYKSGTLEGIINSWSCSTATDLALTAKEILFDGSGGVRRFWRTVCHTADVPIRVPVDGAVAIIPRIQYDLGITLWQEHRELSQDDIRFVLAVEDCIRGAVHKASRATEDDATTITQIADRTSVFDSDSLSHCQSVVLFKDWVDFDFDHIKKGQYYDQPGYPAFVPKSAVTWRSFK